MTSRVIPHGGAAKSGTGMTEIMPVPRNLMLLSYQQGGWRLPFLLPWRVLSNLRTKSGKNGCKSEDFVL